MNLLYEIQKEEQKVHEETNKARQERIKKILEGESAAPPAGESTPASPDESP